MPRSLRSAAAAVFLVAAATAARAQEYVEGFEETIVASGFVTPTAMTFLEDENHFLVAEKTGNIYLVRYGEVVQPPMLVLPCSSESERGVLTMQAEPGFAGAGYVYIYYTLPEMPRFARISRFFWNEAGPGLEEIVVDGIQSDSGQHNGGGMAFGPDGTLYFGVGDGGEVVARAQDPSQLHGSVCRVNPDGSIPADNPYVGVPGYRPEIFAKGFRNPWRIAIDRVTGQLYVNDVGRALHEEVNRVAAGANHGWPLYEGPGSSPPYVEPLYSYPHAGESSAVTGATLYRGAQYPLEYDGSFFFADFNRGRIQRLTQDENGDVDLVETIATGLTRPVTMIEGPDGKLYYVAFFDGWIFRIDYVGSANRRPTLRLTFDPDSAVAPFDVVFDATATTDPDGDPLTFTYRFDSGETFTTSSRVFVARLEEPRVHAVRVIVNDGAGGSDRRTVHVDAANLPPAAPVITLPLGGSLYSAGERIDFAGHASDPEDGAIPASRLSWSVVFHHADHIHPYMGPFTGLDSGNFRITREGEIAINVSYELRLSATDSRGISRSSSVFVWPRLTTFRVRTVPAGLPVAIDGRPTPTPIDIPSVIGMRRSLGSAGAPTDESGQHWGLVRWADYPAAERVIAVAEPGLVFEGRFREMYRY